MKVPNKTGLEEKHQREVERNSVLESARTQHPDGHDDGGEQQHQEAEAVDADVILHAERGNPGVQLLELERVRSWIEVVPENQRDRERGEAEGECGPAREILVAAAEGEHNKRADHGHSG